MKINQVIQNELTQNIKNLKLNRFQRNKILNQINKLEKEGSEVYKMAAPLGDTIELSSAKAPEVKNILNKIVAKVTASLPKKIYFKHLQENVDNLFSIIMK